MQQCIFCGASLAEKSLTCNRCGRAQPPNAPCTLSGEGAGRHEPMTQPHVDAQPGQQAQQAQQKAGQFQSYYHRPYHPQPQQPLQEAIHHPVRQEGSAQRYKGQGASRGHSGWKIAMPKWMMAVIALLVIASGLGVFALTSHSAFLAAETSRSATHPSASGTVMQSSNSGKSSAGRTPSANTSKSTSTMPTCSPAGSSSHTGTFTFTGGIAGTISLSTFEACTSATNLCSVTCFSASQNGGHTYFGKVQGKMDGATYQFEFFINPYLGPGTYTSMGNINVVLMRNNYEWENHGASSNHATIVVNANEKIGSMHATISMMSPQFDPTNVVIVTGNWS